LDVVVKRLFDIADLARRQREQRQPVIVVELTRRLGEWQRQLEELAAGPRAKRLLKAYPKLRRLEKRARQLAR
jgi:hypothetical protein